jgi:CDP-diacylglycerol---glycerol-3-phosphate 3-phosphatidyltransferase
VRQLLTSVLSLGELRLMPHRAPAAILDPIVRTLAAAGVTPNAVSVVGFLGNIVGAALVASGALVSGGIVVLLASALDMLDGGLARATGRATPFGGVLDSTLDRLSEAVVLFGIAWYATERGLQTEALLAFVAVVCSLMVSYIRARVEGAGGVILDGVFTRPERVVVTVIALVSGWLLIGLWLLAIVSALTVAQRLWLSKAAVDAATSTSAARKD